MKLISLLMAASCLFCFMVMIEATLTGQGGTFLVGTAFFIIFGAASIDAAIYSRRIDNELKDDG